MRVFVAGATGVIGKRVVRLLLGDGHEVSALARSDAKAEPLRQLGVGVVVADLFDAELLRGAMAVAEPEVVVHQLTALPDALEARDAAARFAENDRMRVDGTRALVDAAAAVGVTRVVAQSIAFAYAPVGGWVKDESAPLFLDAPAPWGASVGAVTELERQVLEARGMDGVVLRYGTLYGPGTWHDPDGGAVAQAVRAGRVPMIGDGDGMQSFTQVDDAASAAVAALEATAGRYNVVDDDPVRARDWLPLLARSLGGPEPPRLSVEEGLERAGWTAVHRMTEQRGASNTRARERLNGWEPAHPSWRAELAGSKRHG
ncbi:MAG TPA: NAD-dependent epimerase/dehydratase family protein [Thermoleophilaceae bacterium]